MALDLDESLGFGGTGGGRLSFQVKEKSFGGQERGEAHRRKLENPRTRVSTLRVSTNGYGAWGPLAHLKKKANSENRRPPASPRTSATLVPRPLHRFPASSAGTGRPKTGGTPDGAKLRWGRRGRSSGAARAARAVTGSGRQRCPCCLGAGAGGKGVGTTDSRRGQRWAPGSIPGTLSLWGRTNPDLGAAQLGGMRGG